jgi:hypothetical protein
LIFIAAMKSRVALIFILFSLSMISQNCGEPEDVYQQTTQEQRDWGAFQIGTWWIYKEEVLNLYDTIRVYSHKKEFLQKPEPESNHYVERVNSYFSSSRLIDSGYFNVVSFTRAVDMIHKNSDLGEHLRECYLVKPPPVQGDWIRNGSPHQINRFDTIYPTYKIGNLEFSNVVRANDNFNYFYLGTPTLIYSAKNIGIIRKEFPEYNQIWNLIDYHIVQ